MNELELILTDICRCNRPALYSPISPLLLSQRQLKRLDAVLRNRANNIPIAYSLNNIEFMGLRLAVTPDVLIPRPETELLVEAAAEKLRKRAGRNSSYRILELGTGSGCIAIALATLFAKAQITATDISGAALVVAQKNARRHRVNSRIRFIQSDLLTNSFFSAAAPFDIIVSNPPYVATHEIGVFDITTCAEPRIALDGGVDGCDFYRKLSRAAVPFLANDGSLVLEIGEQQGALLQTIFMPPWNIEEIKKDYCHRDRICIITKIS